jgi:hypothetical protein
MAKSISKEVKATEKKATIVAEAKTPAKAKVKAESVTATKVMPKVIPTEAVAAKPMVMPKVMSKAMPNLSEDIAAAAQEVIDKKIAKTVSVERVQTAGEAGIASVTKNKTKYSVTIDGVSKLESGSKVAMAVELLRHALNNGMSVSELNGSKFVATFDLLKEYPKDAAKETIVSDLGKAKVRYSTKEDKHIHIGDFTYVVCNQWYPENAEKLILAMKDRFNTIEVKTIES